MARIDGGAGLGKEAEAGVWKTNVETAAICKPWKNSPNLRGATNRVVLPPFTQRLADLVQFSPPTAAWDYKTVACDRDLFVIFTYDDDEALRVVSRSVYPTDSGEAAFSRAVALEESGDMDAAVMAYAEAVESGHGGAANNLGNLHQRLGDEEKARVAYERGVELKSSRRGVGLEGFGFGALRRVA